MFKSVSYKTKQLLALVIKILIVITCGFFITNKIASNQQQSFSDFSAILTKNNIFSLKNAFFLMIFTFFNWFFEIKKWHLLANKLEQISFFEAAKQSLASLTASLITPNRIGEYGAKAIYFKKELRKKVVALNFIGNFSQLAITLLFGIVGCSFLYFNFSINLPTTKLIYFFIFLFFIIIFFWFIYKKGIAFKGFSLKKLKIFMTDFSKKSIQKIALFSVFRYLIFSHQFYFLLLIFNIEIDYTNALMCIFSMYVIASIIPMLSLFDVVVKGSIAIAIFALYQIDETIILAVVLLMWIFNFVLPSIVGSYFVLTFKTEKLINNNV